MKKLLISSICLFMLTTVGAISISANAETLTGDLEMTQQTDEIEPYYDPEGPNSVYNYATNTEIVQLKYKGYLQFKPSYKVPTYPGYGLIPMNYVKRGYINYVRDDQSLTNGRAYTSLASSKNDNIYSISREVIDSLNPWAPKTEFYYGWEYF